MLDLDKDPNTIIPKNAKKELSIKKKKIQVFAGVTPTLENFTFLRASLSQLRQVLNINQRQSMREE